MDDVIEFNRVYARKVRKPVVPVEFWKDVLGEFRCEKDRVKLAELILYPGAAPILKLHIELNEQQTKALHWIMEGEEDAQEDQQIPHAEQA